MISMTELEEYAHEEWVFRYIMKDLEERMLKDLCRQNYLLINAIYNSTWDRSWDANVVLNKVQNKLSELGYPDDCCKIWEREMANGENDINLVVNISTRDYSCEETE